MNMSLLQALAIVQSGLANIKVPAGLIDEIGVPISTAIKNLEQIRIAVQNKEKKNETESDPQEEENESEE